MKFTAQQIATVVHGEVVGDPNAMVHSFAKIEESKTGDLCFLANLAVTNLPVFALLFNFFFFCMVYCFYI